MENIPIYEWEWNDWCQDQEKIAQRQNLLTDLGLVTIIVELISDQTTDDQIRKEVILLCVGLLIGGNSHV